MFTEYIRTKINKIIFLNKILKYFILLIVSIFILNCQEPNISKILDVKSNLVAEESCDISTQYRNLLQKNRDELNYYLNLAGFAYQENDYQKSNQYFDKAIEKYRYFENKGAISASRTLSYITASFFNDTFLEYEGDGYEKVMIHNYKAINYLLLGKKESARIEIRNSYKKQMQEKAKFKEEIQEYKQSESKQLIHEKKLPRKKRRYRRSKESIYEKLKPLFTGVDSAHVPYQNPFAYYVSALVYEENDEFDDAYIDIKKASDLYPESKILKEKLLYYAKKAYGENSQEYKKLKASQNILDNLSDKRAELFINISQSPIKEQMKVPIYMGGAMQFTSFPTFKLYKSKVDHIIIKDNHGKIITQSSILTDVDAIVINIFKERVPGIILRQVINVGSKTVASESISNKLDNGNVLVSAAVGLGMSLLNATTSKADIRRWSTLPSKIHALSFNFDNKKHYIISLIDHNGKELNHYPLKLQQQLQLKNIYSIITIKDKSICK